MRSTFTSLACLLTSTALGAADAATLVTIDSSVSRSSVPGVVGASGDVFFGFALGSSSADVDSGSEVLADDVNLFSAPLVNDGVQRVSSGTAFDTFVDLITNGDDDAAGRATGFGTTFGTIAGTSGSFALESALIGSDPTSLNGIDLAGFEITEVVLFVDSFLGGASANQLSLALAYRIEIIGERLDTNPIPIPGAAPLFAVALGSAAAFRGRRGIKDAKKA